MKITIETNRSILSHDFKNDDIPIYDLYNAFKGLLIGVTFLPCTIDNYIIEEAENIKEIRNE